MNLRLWESTTIDSVPQSVRALHRNRRATVQGMFIPASWPLVSFFSDVRGYRSKLMYKICPRNFHLIFPETHLTWTRVDYRNV